MDKNDENVDQIGSSADFKSGQKYPTPSPGNGDRVFYETLIEQLPNSEMAQEWCLAYGILDQNRAFKLNAIVCKRKGKSVPSTQQNGKILSSQTGKSVIASKTTNSKRKKTTVDDDVIGDTGLDSSSAWEGIGTTGI